MNHLSIDQFEEVIRHMPDIEAKQQIELRRDHLCAVNALLTEERAKIMKRNGSRTSEYVRLGQELSVVFGDQGRLRRMLGEVNERMSRINWSKAVTALFGQEGWEACREWMAANFERPEKEPEQ